MRLPSMTIPVALPSREVCLAQGLPRSGRRMVENTLTTEFSTALTLYVVPTVYVIFDAVLDRVGGRTRRRTALVAAEAE